MLVSTHYRKVKVERDDDTGWRVNLPKKRVSVRSLLDATIVIDQYWAHAPDRHKPDVPPKIVCVHCGEIELSHATNKLCVLLGACFDCTFWCERIATKHRHVRIDGKCYEIGPEGEPGMRGFAGRRFVILFSSGEKVMTTNLWHQGEIPARWRKDLPDNANFVNE